MYSQSKCALDAQWSAGVPFRVVICDRCGRDNPPHLIFCQDCGRRLQDAPRRIVEPTPPAGVPVGHSKGEGSAASGAPGAAIASPSFPGAMTSPVAMSEREGPPNICPRCQTRNPSAGKFCVSCGAGLDEAPSAARSAAPGADAYRPQDEPLAPATPAHDRDEQVRPAAVLNVASEKPRASTITCDRCQGVCEGGMRFCKFCGAPLPQLEGARVLPPIPALEPPSNLADYSKPVARHGLQAAIEEVARQASGPSRPVAQPEPLAPTTQGEEVTRVRGRTDPATPDALDASQRGATRPEGDHGRGAAPTAGLYAPFSLRGGTAAGRLVVIAGDGQEGPSFPLVGEQMDVGRTEGTVVLPEDRYMSPRHARLVRSKGRWYVRDLGSTNGVFVRISTPQDLVDSDCLLLGVEVLRFEMIQDAELGVGPAVEHGTLVFGSPALPRPARLVQRTVEGVARDVYHLHRLETVIGRESGDIVFTDDPYLSRRHALIRRDSTTGRFTLIDLDSSNGTFVAIRGDCPVSHGDSIRVGQHLFRIELTQG